jgi:dTDP-4-amino-4,6-dideoxyglucose formyltransferase
MNSKEILIVSDNPDIAKRCEDEVWKHVASSDVKLTFTCSPFSKVSDFNLKNSLHSIDLRKDENVQILIEKYDLIISIHCKQLFPPKLVNNVRCINVHPGYNPINRGWYPQVFAIIHGLDIGATIHEIDELLDHGKIIAREKVQKHSYDTSFTIYNRVVDKEIELLKSHINEIIDNNYELIVPENKGNLFLKKDFNNLCKLDLDEQLTMREAIDRLRALTHGVYKNAYFEDETEHKVYVSIDLTNE